MEDIKPSQNLLQSPKPSKSKYWKFIIGFLAIVLVVFIGFPLAREFYYSLFANRAISNYFKFEKEYLAALKNDTFGGKTPQETYEMFLDTLRKGDILSAAKFYSDEDGRINAYKRFNVLKENNSFDDWFYKLPSWEKYREVEYWDPNGRRFVYEKFNDKERIIDDPFEKGGKITIPPGKFEFFITFKLNKVANIWKIYEI